MVEAYHIGERITKGANVYTILIINSDGIDEDARIYADDIYYVNRKEYVDWAIKALTVVRSVWCTFSTYRTKCVDRNRLQPLKLKGWGRFNLF